MTKTPVPDDVRRFLLTSVPTVPALEALLLLRAQPALDWTAAQVAARLYVPEAQALEVLQGLVASTLITSEAEGRFRFAPPTDDLREVVGRVAATYAADLLGVTEIIHSRVDKRALTFADAFRWKKEDR